MHVKHHRLALNFIEWPSPRASRRQNLPTRVCTQILYQKTCHFCLQTYHFRRQTYHFRRLADRKTYASLYTDFCTKKLIIFVARPIIFVSKLIIFVVRLIIFDVTSPNLSFLSPDLSFSTSLNLSFSTSPKLERKHGESLLSCSAGRVVMPTMAMMIRHIAQLGKKPGKDKHFAELLRWPTLEECGRCRAQLD